MAKITVLGAGTFGTSLAIMSEKCGHQVSLWSYSAEEAASLSQQRRQKNLQEIEIPQNITITADIGCAAKSDLVILAVPSFAVRETCQRLKGVVWPKAILVCVAKGLEHGTSLDFSKVMEQELPENENVILSGPSHAEEVAKGVPTSVVAASHSRHAAEFVQDTLMNPAMRIYVNDDVVGVELGGALKNIIALSAGICDGLGLGDNPKAALMTRGITEIARLGVAMGGRQETFAGLAGIGDLIVTCTSMHSRNRRFGILIGQGVSVEEALRRVDMVVEGYSCTKIAYLLAKEKNVEMPIITQAYEILYGGKAPQQALADLMARPKRHESEEIWLEEKTAAQ